MPVGVAPYLGAHPEVVPELCATFSLHLNGIQWGYLREPRYEDAIEPSGKVHHTHSLVLSSSQSLIAPNPYRSADLGEGYN